MMPKERPRNCPIKDQMKIALFERMLANAHLRARRVVRFD